MEVPDAGWLSIVADPAGAMVGFWKPKIASSARASDEEGAKPATGVESQG